MTEQGRMLKATHRIQCPGGCGKTVAVLQGSGRITVHDNPHLPSPGRLCKAAGLQWTVEPAPRDQQGQHPHTTNGRGGAVPGAARAGNRRAPVVVSAKRPRDYRRAAAPAVVEEPTGPPPGRPSFGLTRRSR